MAILTCALALRVWFATGPVRNDEVNYAHAAYELSKGALHLDYWWQGTTRIANYLPTAILYALFGAHQWTTLAFPIASSLLGVFIVYRIGVTVEREKTGLVAALLWAVFPLDVFQAGTLRPDGPLATFLAISVLFLILANKSRNRKRYFYLALSIFFLLWSLAIKPLALVIVLFFGFIAALALWKNRHSILRRIKLPPDHWIQQAAFSLLVLVGALTLVYMLGFRTRDAVVLLGETATNAERLILLGETNANLARGLNTTAFLLTGGLLIVALVTLLHEKRRSAGPLLAWFGFVFLYYEWGTIETSFAYFPILDFVEARNILFVMVPAILLIAAFVVRHMDVRLVRIGALLGAVSTTAVGWILGEALIANLQLPAWFYATVALALFFVLFSPALFSKQSGYLPTVTLLFLLVVPVASLLPAPPYHISYWNAQREYRADLGQIAMDLVHTQGTIFVPSAAVARDLNLASDFALGFAWSGDNPDDPSNRLRVGSPAISAKSAYVVRRAPAPSSLPWIQLGQYVNPYRTLYLYQVSGQ